VQVINDRTGPLNNFSAYGTYAYHVGLSPRMNLAAGIGMGVSNLSLNTDQLRFNVAVDPAVYTKGTINNYHFDMNAGLYLYSSDFFVGLSALQIVPSKIDFSNNTITTNNGKKVPHLFATAGYRFLLGEDFNLIPSVMVKYLEPTPVQVEGNAKLQYRDLMWVGASYRHLDGVAAMVGLYVSNRFTVGYSYDYTTSRLNNYTKGTHEIVLGFTLGNKFGSSCPTNVW
jgi:type IX secretion system PorP/SprF family membrane protein